MEQIKRVSLNDTEYQIIDETALHEDHNTDPTAHVDIREQINQLSSEIVDLPNNELLVQNVAQKVPYVKVAEHPTFVNSVNEMTDTSKMYVLKSDGMFYSYKARTITTPGGTTANFTNQVPTSIDTDGSVLNGKGYVGATRLSSSGATKASDYVSATGYIPASSGAVIRIKGVDWLDSNRQSANYVCTYNSKFEFISAVSCTGYYNGGAVSGDDDVAIVTLLANSNIAYVRVSAMHGAGEDGYAGVTNHSEGPGSYLIVTVNQEITYTTTEPSTSTTYSWESTGISYNQPADYEDRVIAMENELGVLLNGTF